MRAIHGTASRNSRSLRPLRPGSVGPPRRGGPIAAHRASASASRSIHSVSHIRSNSGHPHTPQRCAACNRRMPRQVHATIARGRPQVCVDAGPGAVGSNGNVRNSPARPPRPVASQGDRIEPSRNAPAAWPVVGWKAPDPLGIPGLDRGNLGPPHPRSGRSPAAAKADTTTSPGCHRLAALPTINTQGRSGAPEAAGTATTSAARRCRTGGHDGETGPPPRPKPQGPAYASVSAGPSRSAKHGTGSSAAPSGRARVRGTWPVSMT